ncbi:phage tail tube protein [Henriciella sp.]|uniref:phage tail tube protein n=1 Tax=Henriciella sp. TaxID=1968823 RepID=UPI0026235EC6|nr:phage tail tube protein [Henriciella sp.]
MALAQTIKFGSAMIMLGDGASSETFEAPCGFTELTMTVNIESNTTNIPDCEDPDLPSWLISDEVSKQMTLSGSGVLDKDAKQIWDDWVMAGGEKNVRWFIDLPSGEGGGYYEAPAILTQYEQTFSRGQRANVSIGIAMNGKPSFTAGNS